MQVGPPNWPPNPLLLVSLKFCCALAIFKQKNAAKNKVHFMFFLSKIAAELRAAKRKSTRMFMKLAKNANYKR